MFASSRLLNSKPGGDVLTSHVSVYNQIRGFNVAKASDMSSLMANLISDKKDTSKHFVDAFVSADIANEYKSSTVECLKKYVGPGGTYNVFPPTLLRSNEDAMYNYGDIHIVAFKNGPVIPVVHDNVTIRHDDVRRIYAMQLNSYLCTSTYSSLGLTRANRSSRRFFAALNDRLRVKSSDAKTSTDVAYVPLFKQSFRSPDVSESYIEAVKITCDKLDWFSTDPRKKHRIVILPPLNIDSSIPAVFHRNSVVVISFESGPVIPVVSENEYVASRGTLRSLYSEKNIQLTATTYEMFALTPIKKQ